MYYFNNLICLILLLSLNLSAQNLGDITIYNSNNSELNYNQINCIEFDAQNRLWVGTSNGLSVFNQSNNNWSNFNTSSTPWCYLPTNNITALEWANDLSMMFIGTSNGIVDYWDDGSPLNDKYPGAWCPAFGSSCNPNNGVINSLFYDDGIWAGSTDGLCIQYMGGEGDWLLQNTQTGFYSNNITSITQNLNQDIIGIGTLNGGLVAYNGEFITYYSSNSDILDNSVLDVVFDQNNNIIICTPQAGLGVLTESGSWIWFNTVTSTLPTNSLQKVVLDNNNNLWITTLENGLIHYKDNTFYNYTTENSNLPDNKINCLKFGPDNHLWLGTDTAGLIKINTPVLLINDHPNKKTYAYPTIFRYNINIDLSAKSNITIINQKGEHMNHYVLSQGVHKINTSNYKSGIYFILLESKNHTMVEKIIKL